MAQRLFRFADCTGHLADDPRWAADHQLRRGAAVCIGRSGTGLCFISIDAGAAALLDSLANRAIAGISRRIRGSLEINTKNIEIIAGKGRELSSYVVYE